MCICLKLGLRGCPNYFGVKAGHNLDEKESTLCRTVKSCPVWFWTVGGNDRTHTKLGSPKALSSFHICCHVYWLKEICVWEFISFAPRVKKFATNRRFCWLTVCGLSS